MNPTDRPACPLSSVRSLGLALALAIGACGSPGASPSPDDPVVFEGARILIGDGREIEHGTFIVQDGRFTAVGSDGAVTVPEGSTRVDLRGMTVIPTLVDMHIHIGFLDVPANTNAAVNYTHENLVEHLRRMAYQGIGAAVSMGLDADETAFRLRVEGVSDGARLLLAGRGIAMPNAGPGNADRRDRAYGVRTEEEARAAVRELAARDVDIVKIWVDDRNGTVPKLTPELYRAVIDEAHQHGLLVSAHIVSLADAKDLLRAGIDGFAHSVRDREIDDEFLTMLAERPQVFLNPNLPSSGLSVTEDDLSWLGETLPAEVVAGVAAELAEVPPSERAPGASFLVQARNLERLSAAGVRIALGTDGAGQGWNVHEEMADMVLAGMTPAEVLMASTSVPAQILGLEDLGTIETGKSADFVVLEANPLEDIRNTRRISGLFLRGREIDRAAMRAAWGRSPP